MKKITFLTLMTLISLMIYGQERANVFMIFFDFKSNTPSKYLGFAVSKPKIMKEENYSFHSKSEVLTFISL